jgi:hypothetical protein
VAFHELLSALQFFTPQIAMLAGSTTFREVTRGALRKFKIPVPPLSEQRRIVEILDQADELRPDSYFPTDANRYAQTLARYLTKLGAGFLQRSHEAAKCYQARTHSARKSAIAEADREELCTCRKFRSH